jgi:hypothetical protein
MGVLYLLKNNLINNYDYYIFTQDTFVLKNKYHFNIFKNNNIFAAAINVSDLPRQFVDDHLNYYITSQNILKKINLYDNLDKIKELCYCSCFVLHKTKIKSFYNYIKNIIITNKTESIMCEFLFTRILYELNNHNNFYIDGFSHSFNLDRDPKDYDRAAQHINNDIFSYFEKKIQGKANDTIDSFINLMS